MSLLKKLGLSASLLLAAHLGHAQHVAVLKLAALQQRLARPTDTTYVVNFWATWCGPCVQELPGFEKVRAANANKKIKFLLVSLDYVSQLEKRVEPFVQKHGIRAEVVLLDEPDPTTWLTKIDRSWAGAIPFTLILNNKANQRRTFVASMTEAELTTALRKFPN